MRIDPSGGCPSILHASANLEKPSVGSETELRDRLAVERTRLANERTVLAYIRTALTIVVTGAGIVHLIGTPLAHFGGWTLIFGGVLLLPFGFWRFRRAGAQLRDDERA